MSQDASSETLERKQRRAGFIQRNIAPVAAAVVLVGTLVTGTIMVGQANADADAAREDVTTSQQELTAAKEALREKNEAQVEAVTGKDVTRIEADDKRIGEIMKLATTWSTGAEYDNAREKLVSVYGIPEDSDFMTGFMMSGCKTARNGDRICLVDTNGMKVSYRSVRTSVIDIKATDYSYFALVEMRVWSTDGSASVTQTVPITYTMDNDQNISDLTAYSSTSVVDTSD